MAVKTFGVCDFSRLAVTDWRLRRWRLWFSALMTATPFFSFELAYEVSKFLELKRIKRFRLTVLVNNKSKKKNYTCSIWFLNILIMLNLSEKYITSTRAKKQI